jgi:hypothetical protein
MQYLGVFYAVATIANSGVVGTDFAEETQGFPVTRITYGVDANLEARRHHGRGKLRIKSILIAANASMARHVAVIIQ